MSEQFREIFGPYKEMSVRYDRNQEALWCYFKPQQRPCFSPTMLQESKQIQQAVIRYFESIKGQEEFPVRYMILASQTPGVFNLGGVVLFGLYVAGTFFALAAAYVMKRLRREFGVVDASIGGA